MPCGAIASPFVIYNSLENHGIIIRELRKLSKLSIQYPELREQKNPNELDSDGNSALGWSILKSRIEITQALLEAGADVNHHSKFGAAVFVAASNGDVKRLELLLNYAPVLQLANGESALHAAIKTNAVAAADLLLRKHVDPNQSDSRGLYPIHLAVKELNPDMVSLLHKYGADFSKLTPEGASALRLVLDETPLRGEPRLRVVRFLRDSGAPCVPRLKWYEYLKVFLAR